METCLLAKDLPYHQNLLTIRQKERSTGALDPLLTDHLLMATWEHVQCEGSLER